MPLPSSVDYRPDLPPVRDQGQRPTCVAFALTAAHEWERKNGGESGDIECLSEELLYWAGRKLEADQTPGLYLNSGATALKETGQPYANLWPYDDTRDEMGNYDPPPDAVDSDSCFRRASMKIIPKSATMKFLLSQKILSVITVLVGSGFDSPIHGLVSMPSPGESMGDSHAVLLVGYDDNIGGGAFIFRNSWGEDWGEDGYGFLPYDYVDSYGKAGCHLQEKIP